MTDTPMRFCMIDQIAEVHSGVRLTALKTLRAEEEYLKDHFPRFPVMPGVLMLEAMFQASMWLVRKSEDFAHSIVLLKEARNVKFADFVEPGEMLTVHAEIIRQDDQTTLLKAHATVEDSVAVSGRLVLERFDLADRYPEYGAMDGYVRRTVRDQFAKLCGVDASVEVTRQDHVR